MTGTRFLWLTLGSIALVVAQGRADPFPAIPVPAVTSPAPPGPIAYPADPSCRDLRDRYPFDAGMCDFQYICGYSVGLNGKSDGPKFDYSPQSFRFGYMLTSPVEEPGCWYRGNVEAVLDLTYGVVIHDFGHYLAGPAALLRYNFVQPDCIVTPYVQAGVGVMFTDAPQWANDYQKMLANEVQLSLRLEFGARIMLNDRLSLDAEIGYQHVTSAGMGSDQDGLHNLGLGIGMTFFFGKP